MNTFNSFMWHWPQLGLPSGVASIINYPINCYFKSQCHFIPNNLSTVSYTPCKHKIGECLHAIPRQMLAHEKSIIKLDIEII